METHNPTKKAYCSIGAFLCRHPTAPPVEDVDRPSPLDVKQDAALRALVGLRKLGKALTDDAVATFDAEPKLVALAYQWASRDALKRHLGRGGLPRPQLVRWGNEELSDPAQDAALADVEEDAAAELRRIYDEGIPNLRLGQTRRVLALMAHVQELRAQGTTRLPPPLRQQLRRLRKETRLPLDTRLL